MSPAQNSLFDSFQVDSSFSGEIRLLAQSLLAKITSSSYKMGPYASLVQFGQFCYLAGLDNYDVRNARCVDFGCGGTRPFNIASLLYLSGAKSALCVDHVTIKNEPDIALGIYCLLIQLLSTEIPHVRFSSIGATESLLKNRATEFDMRRLISGDLRGLPAQIRYLKRDFATIARKEREFDFLFTGSVLEHVSDVPGCLDMFRHSISSSGVIFAVVDLRDHRLYGNRASPWQFMLDGGDVAHGFVNKLRYSDFVREFARAGFRISQMHVLKDEIPSQVRKNLLPEFRDLDETDLATVEMRVLLRPG